jgi:hypothetical protein
MSNKAKKKPANLPSPAVIRAMQEKLERKASLVPVRKSVYAANEGLPDTPAGMPFPVVTTYKPAQPQVAYPLRANVYGESVPVIGPLDEYAQEEYERKRRQLFMEMAEVKGPQF